MKEVMKGEDPNVKFPESANVVSATYCTASGDLAGSACSETKTGWYKKNNIPGTCTRCYGDSTGFWGDNNGFWNSDDEEETDDGGFSNFFG